MTPWRTVCAAMRESARHSLCAGVDIACVDTPKNRRQEPGQRAQGAKTPCTVRRMSLLLGITLATLWAAPAVRAEPVVADPLAELEAAQQRLFVRLAPSVVFIHTKTGFGSGFLVSRDGLVLTNAHVVEAQATVGVVTHDGQKLTGTVLERAKNADLALVQLPLAKTVPIPLGDSELLRVGAWAGAIGHGRGGIWTFNTGMVSNIYPLETGRPVFQTQIPLNPGASGGPILDRKGQVIGVVTAGLTDAESINFGIKIDVALRELKPLAARCECLVVLAPVRAPPGPTRLTPASALTPGPAAQLSPAASRRPTAGGRRPSSPPAALAVPGPGWPMGAARNADWDAHDARFGARSHGRRVAMGGLRPHARGRALWHTPVYEQPLTRNEAGAPGSRPRGGRAEGRREGGLGARGRGLHRRALRAARAPGQGRDGRRVAGEGPFAARSGRRQDPARAR
jgi:serine protease Do